MVNSPQHYPISIIYHKIQHLRYHFHSDKKISENLVLLIVESYLYMNESGKKLPQTQVSNKG